jgi:hypothetical protein
MTPSKVLLLFAGSAHAGCKVGPVKCYVDTDKRILGGPTYEGMLTQEYCAQVCSDAKMPLAGVENGEQCMCGKAVDGAAPAKDSDCGTKCSGNNKEACGGEWRIGVFDVSCSGDPVPQPASPPRLNNPCAESSSAQSKQPWCNAELPIDARVKDMISRLSIAEKIDALDTSESPLNSLGLNAYNWWSEATHGISHVSNTPSRGTKYETNFAFPITTAMSFNRSMWWATGQQIGREARAFMNVGDAWSTYWAPVINLAREPRWGRNLEVSRTPTDLAHRRQNRLQHASGSDLPVHAPSTPHPHLHPSRTPRPASAAQTPGEDPFMSGEYATAWVQGFEHSKDDPTHIQASACCKHYAANSMESSTVAGEHWTRQSFDANISARDLVDSYLLPFQACVEKGKVTGLMCSCARSPLPRPLRPPRPTAPPLEQTTRSTACPRAPTTGCLPTSRATRGASTATVRAAPPRARCAR